jgi:hypothetical protein
MILWILFIRYAVVIDAGTTQSSILAYTWDETVEPPEITPFRHPSVKLPTTILMPLANAVRDRNAIATIFNWLLPWAKATIPADAQSSTDIFVLATSGMRRLEEDSQKVVMSNVHAFLVADGSFRAILANCRVLSVREEGGYHWAALNILMGLTGTDSTRSVVSIASVNAIFVTEFRPSFADSLRPWRQEIQIREKNYFLFVAPLLNFGMDEAISSHVVALASASGRASVESPCFNQGYTESIEEIALSGKGNYQACYDSLTKSLELIDCDYDNCLFSGIPRPALTGLVALETPYYAREIFDFPEDATIAEYAAAGTRLCGMTFSQAQAEYGTNPWLQQHCFYTAYIVNFFKRGLGLGDEDRPLILLDYENQTISFTIGAVISLLYPPEPYEKGLTAIEIGVIIVFSVVFLVLVIDLIICCCVSSRKKKKEDEETKQDLLEHWDDEEEYPDMPTRLSGATIADVIGAPELNQTDAVVGAGLAGMADIELNLDRE